MNNLVLGIGSVAGGLFFREVMNYFNIELMSVKGFVICLITAIIYSLILNSIL